MLVVITPERQFWQPVEVMFPDPSPSRPGTFLTATFWLQFQTIPLDRAQQLAAKRDALPQPERVAWFLDVLLPETIHGWRGVVTADGVAMLYSRAMLGDQLKCPWFRAGVLQAYDRAFNGLNPAANGKAMR